MFISYFVLSLFIKFILFFKSSEDERERERERGRGEREKGREREEEGRVVNGRDDKG